MTRDGQGVDACFCGERAYAVIGVAALMVGLLCPTESAADVVTLRSGRTVVIRMLEFDPSTGRTMLHLTSGGSVSCEPGLIVDIRTEATTLPPPPSTDSTPESAGEQTSVDEPSLTHLPYGELVARAAAPYRLRPSLVHAVIDTESRHRPDARSPKGAVGLMQLMPATAAVYGVTHPANVDANVHTGVRHLYRLLTRYPLPIALAAYNAGEGAVLRHGGIPPFEETRHYVERVLMAFRRLSGHQPAARPPQAPIAESGRAAGRSVQEKRRAKEPRGDSAIILH